MLRMQGISKIYRHGLLQTHALRGLDLDVRAGEFLAIMGPSGSGKTSLLNIAGLLEAPAEGEYWLDGEPTRRLGDARRTALRNGRIGFIFQSFQLLPDLTVAENIEVPLHYRGLGAGERRARVGRALEQLGLSARADHRPSQLSGGQQQRVAIARALAGEPQLLLADEPTGNLDSLAAREVMRALSEINSRGATVIMVTHAPELARHAHRRLYLLDGQLGGSVEREPLPAFSAPRPLAEQALAATA